MAVRIRLKRTGAKNNACYRIIVADQRAARDGRAIEILGFYDPRHKEESVDLERAEYWVAEGAQPSETVTSIIERAKKGIKLADFEKKPKPSKKAVAKAEAAKKAAEKAAEEAKKAAEEAKNAEAAAE
jgi:small subunit ribosomal protein S16